MSDLEAVRRHIESLPSDTEINDATARVIASLYHYGQASLGYGFASTGAITDPTDVWRDLFGVSYADLPAAEREIADYLGTYLLRHGTRGPMPHWHTHWL